MAGPLAEANRYRFSSKEWHENSGLVYCLYRYYEPKLQRWVNRDPLGDVSFASVHVDVVSSEKDALNVFRFLENDPLNFVDFLWLGSDCRNGARQVLTEVRDDG